MLLQQEGGAREVVTGVGEALRQEWRDAVELAPELTVAAVVLVLAVVVGRVVARIVGSLLERGRMRPIQRQFFSRVASWVVYLLGFAVILNILGLRTAAAGLMAGGGITAIMLGFAFRQIGENFLAGLFLAFGSPFKVGDLIESQGLKGTVRSIELRSTHIRTADGRDIFVPNSQILNQPLVNYTRDGFLRPAFTIGIDYADDVLAACRLLAREVTEVERVRSEPPPVVSIESFEGAWVLVEIAFWLDIFEPGVSLPEVKSEAMDRCRRALQEAGYTLSPDTTTAISLGGRSPLEVRLGEGA